MSFKDRIINIGIKYQKVAELLNISKAHLNHLLNYHRNITPEIEEKLTRILTEYEKAYERIHTTPKQDNTPTKA